MAVSRILAEIRGVPPEDAGRGTGYGEVFEAMVLLHEAAADAFQVLTTAGDRGLYGLVFSQWAAALAADAAVLAQRVDAATWVARAEKSPAGNPVAPAITPPGRRPDGRRCRPGRAHGTRVRIRGRRGEIPRPADESARQKATAVTLTTRSPGYQRVPPPAITADWVCSPCTRQGPSAPWRCPRTRSTR